MKKRSNKVKKMNRVCNCTCFITISRHVFNGVSLLLVASGDHKRMLIMIPDSKLFMQQRQVFKRLKNG